jgi:hypothetical protein
MDNKTKIIIGAGVAAVAAYFLFIKKDSTDKLSGEFDNPVEGPYMGDKERSEGNASTEFTLEPKSGFSTCLPALESEGGGKGKYISIDDPYTPAAVETARRQLITDELNVGDTVDLDGRDCKIKKFWVDADGLDAAINCENHDNITFTANSQICWS